MRPLTARTANICHKKEFHIKKPVCPFPASQPNRPGQRKTSFLEALYACGTIHVPLERRKTDVAHLTSFSHRNAPTTNSYGDQGNRP